MSSITDLLAAILAAKKGEEVRGSIHDAIELCYQDGKAGVNDLQARQLIEAVAEVNEQQAAALEVLQARVEELEQGEGGSSQQSTTIDIPTVLVDGGVVENVSVNNNSTTTRHITFTTEFTETPKVMVAIGKNVGAVSQYGYLSANILYPTITTTGFDFFLANRTGSDRSPGVVWYAYQPTVKTIDLDITIPETEGMTEAQVREITGPISAAVDAIKTGYDGTVYQTAAEAIRTQINDLHVLIGDEPGTAINASAIGYGEDSNVEDALDGLNERLEALEESGTGGLTVEQITALSAIVKKIAFNGNADNEIDAFSEAFGLISVTGVSLNTTSGSLEVGETLQLVATVLPANALDKSVTWTSSNSAVATVSNNGLITAVGIGTFTVTVTTNDGAYTATFNGTTSAATVKYPVTYNLSNVTSSNNIAQVTQGDSYTTAISVNTGYLLGSISVTMGGTDVTAEVVSGKNISISTITGAIVITATASEDTRTLLYSWDLTQSLTDTVQGATATIASSGASQDSEGVHITSATGYCAFPNDIAIDAEITIEVDVASADFKFSSGHGRLITFGTTSSPTGSGDGVIYRSTGHWAIYLGAWSNTSSFTGKNDFSGKTLKITKTSNNTFTLYCDGVEVTSKQQTSNVTVKRLVLGTSNGNAFYNAIFSAVRIYEGVA